MPLEQADYIGGLVPANPATTDQVQEGDDHMRLIKKCVQQSFPNIDSVVTTTPADLNILTGSGEEGRGVASFVAGDQFIMTAGEAPPGFTISEVVSDRLIMLTDDPLQLGDLGGSWNNANGISVGKYTVDGVNVHFLGGGGLETPSEDHRHSLTSTYVWRPQYMMAVIVQKDE